MTNNLIKQKKGWLDNLIDGFNELFEFEFESRSKVIDTKVNYKKINNSEYKGAQTIGKIKTKHGEINYKVTRLKNKKTDEEEVKWRFR